MDGRIRIKDTAYSKETETRITIVKLDRKQPLYDCLKQLGDIIKSGGTRSITKTAWQAERSQTQRMLAVVGVTATMHHFVLEQANTYLDDEGSIRKMARWPTW